MIVSQSSQGKIILEPLGGAPDRLEAVLAKGSFNVTVSPLEVKFFNFDGKDFIGNGLEKPSGAIDLHLQLIKEAKSVKMIRIVKGESAWSYPSNGINSVIKVFDEGRNLDLYFEPPGSWEKVTFDITVIYKDDSISRQSAIVQ